MAGETVSDERIELPISTDVRRCAAVGRTCLATCEGAGRRPIAYGGQGGTEEAGGMSLYCPENQQPDLHAELYY